MQNVSVKGWSNFSTMFSDGSKTSLPPDGAPNEDSSLLGGGGYGSTSYQKYVNLSDKYINNPLFY